MSLYDSKFVLVMFKSVVCFLYVLATSDNYQAKGQDMARYRAVVPLYYTAAAVNMFHIEG